jgi:hypothetical protein
MASVALDEVLDDLCVRFLVNIPEEETADTNRICFTVEQVRSVFVLVSSSIEPQRLLLQHRH